MSWIDWACLGIIIAGFVLFLYGANYYDITIGWVGVYLFVGGILAFLALHIYNLLVKRERVQSP